MLTNEGRTCASCRRHSALFSVRVATDYADVSKVLVRHLKFTGARAAAEHIAGQMRPFVPDDVLLVPVPTATSRVRQRGFDQALLITKHLSYQTGSPYSRVLRRLGQTRQVGATRAQRLRQLHDSFDVPRPALVRGRHIVLIDDVMTTGATLEAAAGQLKQAGASRIEAIVFAHA